MKYLRSINIFLLVCLVTSGPLISGCAVMEIAIVGAGTSATKEDTGFLRSYEGLTPLKNPSYSSLPDLSYIAPNARVSTYSKVLMTDFFSITPNVGKLSGLQIRQYKAIKQELPDQLANTFDGSIFSSVIRIKDRFDPKDTAAIRRLPGDAVLIGNIKELISLGGENKAGLTAIQIEFKLVDIKTGEEVVAAIHRSTTDLDKVAMSQARALSSLLNMAKDSRRTGSSTPPPEAVEGSQSSPKPSQSALTTGETHQTIATSPTIASPPKAMSSKEIQTRLMALGYLTGVADGVMGAKSVSALKKFQQDAGIKVTGSSNSETILELQKK